MNKEKDLFEDIDFCKDLITEALECDVMKTPDHWSWWKDNIILVQEGTPLYDKLIKIMQTSNESGQWLYNVMLMEVLNDLTKRYRAILELVSDFEQYVDKGVAKINAAQWSVEFYGGDIDE